MNATRFMLRNDIAKIERQVLGRFVVVLVDGRIGVGMSAEEALTKALGDDWAKALQELAA